MGRSNHREAVWVVAACSSRGTTPEGKPAAKAEPAAESGAGSFAHVRAAEQRQPHAGDAEAGAAGSPDVGLWGRDFGSRRKAGGARGATRAA